VSSIVCVNCGVVTSEFRGSYVHPFCVKCFRSVWGDDEKRYVEWVDKCHV
jgi:hypothetical protein